MRTDDLAAVVAVHLGSGRVEIEPGSFRRGTGIAFLDEPQPSFFWRGGGATVHARASDILAIETAGEALVDLPAKAILNNDVIPGDFDPLSTFHDGLSRPGAYAQH